VNLIGLILACVFPTTSPSLCHLIYFLMTVPQPSRTFPSRGYMSTKTTWWEVSPNVTVFHSLVWDEVHESMESAIERGKRLKEWKRKWKLELIESSNSNWQDLYNTIV